MKIIKPLFKITFIFIILFMILMFTGYLLNNDPDKIPATVDVDTLLPSIEVHGNRFHCETFGSKDNMMLLVLHGGMGGDFKYLRSLRILSNHFFVVLYDRRGTGLSPRTEGRFLTVDTAIADIHSIIQFFKPEDKVNLLGHDWGAILGTGYASKHPEKINKIIIAEPDFLINETVRDFFEFSNGLRPEFSLSALKHLINSYFESSHVDGPDPFAGKDYLFNKLMYKSYKGHPLRKYFCGEDIGGFVLPHWRSGALASQYLMSSVFNNDGGLLVDLTSGLDTCKFPVLMLASECNVISGDNLQQKHQKIFNNPQYEVFENCGHYFMLENKELFFSTVSKFLINAN